MINENELRIGNWYEFDKTGPFGGGYGQFNNWQDAGNFIYDSHPIPLTVEILEKCGFKNNEISLGRYAYLDIGLKSGTASVETLELNAGYATIPCKYVHQLQSLYFALTGNELEVKLF